ASGVSISKIKRKAKNRSTGKIYIITIAVAIVIIIIATGVHYYANALEAGSINTGYYINGTAANSFISNYSLPQNISTLYRSSIYNYIDPSCQNTEYILPYLIKGIASPSAPTNFSTVNQSNPLAILIGVGIVAPSYLSQYNATVEKNDGYCLPAMKAISENSTFISIPTKFDGISGYIFNISNFTNEGLNLTYTYYIGPRPNLTWYNGIARYHNAEISVSIWSMTGHANLTMLYNDMNYTVKAFLGQMRVAH
ncbi:MAG: hypothetical protein QXR73_01645, partial [Candidatus Micrarchaeaceae archaeon]